jgi:hypothetical protein
MLDRFDYPTAGIGQRVTRLQVALQVTTSHQNLIAQSALVDRVALDVQTHVLVQIAGIAKRPEAKFALERLEAGVGAYVDLQAVLARVQLAAVDANVSLLRGAHVADNGFEAGGRLQDGLVVGGGDVRRWWWGG